MPTIYGSYEEAYSDPEVDVVYIGTPHAFHKKNCWVSSLLARTCSVRKRSCIAAAKAKRGFSIEAIWTRFAPLIQMIRKILHEEKVIGDVQRNFCGFGLDLDITSLPSESRYKDPALGAGSLLDIGIYSLTWAWYR